MKIVHCFFLLILLSEVLCAQKLPEDWDNYYTSSKNKPVSITVNLALQPLAPVKLKPFALIFRLKIIDPNEDGLPSNQEQLILENLENKIETELGKNVGAVFVGRFTQRSIREYYFYSGDTLAFRESIEQVMKEYPSYSWLAKSESDIGWSHYLNVLYPTVYDLEKIENRRMIDALKKKGDNLDVARDIDHSFRFRSITSRNLFLKTLSLEGFKINSMPNEKNDDETFPYALIISRNELPQQLKMDQLTQKLLREALKVNGRYDGWQTIVIRK